MKLIKSILIAEDELLIAKVLRMQLEKEGYTVSQASDGNEVLPKVEQIKPDLIILDVFLKNNSSGMEAAKLIRSKGINTPIIFTTGNSYEQTVKDSALIVNSVVLTKPVELFQIKEIIKKLSGVLNDK